MPLPRTTSRRPGLAPAVALAALLGVVAVSAPAREARADEVSPDGKGIVGGALLGAEVVTITEALAGVKPGWAYVVGAIVGAGGGGVAGHFIENGSTDGKVPMYMLAGGLALIIPAVVLTLERHALATGRRRHRRQRAHGGPRPSPEPSGGSIVGGAERSAAAHRRAFAPHACAAAAGRSASRTYTSSAIALRRSRWFAPSGRSRARRSSGVLARGAALSTECTPRPSSACRCFT